METQTLNFRRATRDDLPSIVKLLADDPLGVKREKSSVLCRKAITMLHVPRWATTRTSADSNILIW